MTYCRLERWQPPIVNSVVSLDSAEKTKTSAVAPTKLLGRIQERPVKTVQVVNRCFYENRDACVTVGKRFIYRTAQGKRLVLLQFPKCEDSCCRKKLTKASTQECNTEARYRTYRRYRYDIEPQLKNHTDCRIPTNEVEKVEKQQGLKMHGQIRKSQCPVSNLSCPRKSVHFRSFASHSNTSSSTAVGEDGKKEIYDYLKEIDKQKAFLRLANSGIGTVDKATEIYKLKDVKQLSGKRRLPTKHEREQQRAFRLRKWATISEDFRTETLSDFNVSEAVSSLCSNESLISELGLNHREKSSKDRANNNMAKVQAALSLAPLSIATNSNINKKLKFKQEVTDSGVWCDAGQENEFIESATKLNGVDENQSNISPKIFIKNGPTVSSENCSSSNGSNLVEDRPKITELNKKPPIVGCTWWQNTPVVNSNEVKSTCPDETPKKVASNSCRPLNECNHKENKDSAYTLLAEDGAKKSEVHSSQSEPQMTNPQENNAFKHQRQKSENAERLNYVAKSLPQNTQEPSLNCIANAENYISPDDRKKSSYDTHQNGKESTNQNEKYRSSLKRHESYREKERSRRKAYEEHTGRYQRCRYSSNENISAGEIRKSIRKKRSSAFKPISDLNPTPDQNSSKHLFPERTKTTYPNPSSVTCSSCAKALNKGELFFSNDGLYIQTPITAENDPLIKSPSGYLALLNSNNHIIMFQCDCDRCTRTVLLNNRQTVAVGHNELSYSALYPPRINDKKVKTKKMKKKKHERRNSGGMPSMNGNFSNTSKGMNIFSLCFWCMGDGSGSSDSGGSDTGNDDDGGGEEEEEFVEHGDGPDLDDDSDGGDSGSDSGGDDSFNSAELFDDQNNMMDAKQVLGEGDDSDGGPGSAGSDCSDSLTELRSRSKKGSGSSDEEGEDDDDVTEDDDDFGDSWDSIAILERGE